MNLTIYIPTKDRCSFLSTALVCYFATGTKVVVLDASEDKENKRKNEQLCRRFDAVYIYRNALIWPSIKQAHRFTGTDYVCFHGDDDIIDTKTAKKGIDLLNIRTDLDGFCGYAYTSEARRKKHPYPLAETLHDSAIKRIDRQIKNYASPLFSVYRRSVYDRVLNSIPDSEIFCPIRIISDEYLPSFLFVINARVIKIKEDFLLRGIHPNRTKMKNLYDHTKDEIYRSMNYLKSELVSSIIDKYVYFGDAANASNRVIDAIFKRHRRRFSIKNWLRKMLKKIS